MIDVAIVLFALGVALILLALTRDDLQQRYPWLVGKSRTRFP